MRDWFTVVPRLPGAVRSFVSALAAPLPTPDVRDRFSTLFEASPLPLIITMEDSGIVLDVNAAAESVSGWTAAQLRGRSVHEFGHYRDDVDRTSQIEPLSTTPVLSREVRIITARGQELRLLAHTSRLMFEGQRCLLTAMTNVTALGRMDDGLLHAQRMEVVSKLSGGVAHEFNNLLTVMQGHLDALADELGAQSPLRHRVEALRRSVGEATFITAGLLTFAGRNPVRATVIDVNVTLAGLAPVVEGTLGGTVTVAWQLEAAPATVSIDPSHVAQVLLNLALNAREAMPEGGRLTIATEYLTIAPGTSGTEPGPGDWVAIRLTDNGHGMADDIRRHAFEPFFTTKAPGQGTGLGLSICRGIAEQAGGVVIADSAPGRGTTIRLYLPLINAPMVLVPAAVVRDSIAPRRVILLVEDEADVRDIVAELLRRAGHTVHATDGLASTQTFLAQGLEVIDLLLTDLVLPGGNGLEVAKRVRASYPDVPVLFMSGYSESVFSGGETVDHLLQKPFSSNTLLDKIHELLDGR